VGGTLTHEQARRVYDRIGKLQDTQAFYEDRATDLLIAHARFAEAERVFELGCGTGRFAAKLLARELPAGAAYRGIDVSPKMIALATERLAAFGKRASVGLVDGGPELDEPDAGYDRFVSTFVLDLLSERDIAAVLAEAHRMLVPGGLLALTSLSRGAGFLSKTAARAWTAVHRLRPSLVGGCRPLDLEAFLEPRRWRIMTLVRLAPFGIPSEALVAERVASGERT
jgi:ubiquinone/menaquinone biosynthesis C-methylase UbiE